MKWMASIVALSFAFTSAFAFGPRSAEAAQTISPQCSKEININELMKVGSVGRDGYVNVADQLGMTGQRDYSTYRKFPHNPTMCPFLLFAQAQCPYLRRFQ